MVHDHDRMQGDAPALMEDAEEEEEEEEEALKDPEEKRLYKWKDPYASYSRESRESREFKWVNPFKSEEERAKIKAQYEPKPIWEYYQQDDSSQVQATDAPTTTPSEDDEEEEEDGGDNSKGKEKGHGKGRKGKGKGRKGRKNKNKSKSKQRMKSIIDPNFDVNTHQSDSIISNDVLASTSQYSSAPVLPTEPAGVRFQTCDELHCKGGGRCVPDKMRGGVRCQCKLGTQGQFCENGKYSTLTIS
jgi:hypothetical protein